MTHEPPSDFEKFAQSVHSPTLLGEFWQFLRHNKKWWLLPILIVLLVFGLLIFLSGTGAAPFIYTFH
jgi:Family of unknown function (DUF5989)